MSALAPWCPGCETNPDRDGYLSYCLRHRPSDAGLDDAAVRDRVAAGTTVFADGAICRAFATLIHRSAEAPVRAEEVPNDCHR